MVIADSSAAALTRHVWLGRWPDRDQMPQLWPVVPARA